MLEKKKTNKTKILCMLFLVTAIFAGSATAYARTVTDSGKTLRGWTYKFVGEYDSSKGKVSGSTKGDFAKHDGCYSEVEAYVLNGRRYAYGKNADTSVYCNGNAGINNAKIRVRHFVYSKKGTAGAGGHTIY